MATVLKAVGRGEIEPDVVRQMLDTESDDVFSYSLEDPQNLLLYDVEFENVSFVYSHNGVSYIEKSMSTMFQEAKCKSKILLHIKDGYDDRSSQRKLKIRKQEMYKPVRKIKKKQS